MKALCIKSLEKSYGEFHAVKGIDLEIQKGEFFALLGPNGAGKTTTINILCGLVNITSGDVKVFGKDLQKEYQEVRSLIGLVPQEFNFDVFIKLEEMLIFQAGFFNIPKATAKVRSEKLMKQLGIFDKRHSQLRALSGGMKRRAIIARALMHSPKLLILDEPTAGVDVELRHDLYKFLKQVNKEGISILLTTHYIEEAQNLCSKVAIMNHGKIIKVDSTKNLLNTIKGEELHVTFTKKIKLPKTLDKYAPTSKGNTTTLRIEDKDYADLLKILAKLPVDKIETKEKRLEDVFLELTK